MWSVNNNQMLWLFKSGKVKITCSPSGHNVQLTASNRWFFHSTAAPSISYILSTVLQSQQEPKRLETKNILITWSKSVFCLLMEQSHAEKRQWKAFVWRTRSREHLSHNALLPALTLRTLHISQQRWNWELNWNPTLKNQTGQKNGSKQEVMK